jgi:hypothetical protein
VFFGLLPPMDFLRELRPAIFLGGLLSIVALSGLGAAWVMKLLP